MIAKAFTCRVPDHAAGHLSPTGGASRVASASFRVRHRRWRASTARPPDDHAARLRSLAILRDRHFNHSPTRVRLSDKLGRRRARRLERNGTAMPRQRSPANARSRDRRAKACRSARPALGRRADSPARDQQLARAVGPRPGAATRRRRRRRRNASSPSRRGTLRTEDLVAAIAVALAAREMPD